MWTNKKKHIPSYWLMRIHNFLKNTLSLMQIPSLWGVSRPQSTTLLITSSPWHPNQRWRRGSLLMQFIILGSLNTGWISSSVRSEARICRSSSPLHAQVCSSELFSLKYQLISIKAIVIASFDSCHSAWSCNSPRLIARSKQNKI